LWKKPILLNNPADKTAGTKVPAAFLLLLTFQNGVARM
jgi:hypothetical protein